MAVSWKSKDVSEEHYLFHIGFLLGLFFDPGDGSDIFLRNIGWFSTGYAAFSKCIFCKTRELIYLFTNIRLGKYRPLRSAIFAVWYSEFAFKCYTAYTKMIGAVLSGHNGFGNARTRMFPTWNETASYSSSDRMRNPTLPSLLLGPWRYKEKMAAQEQNAFCVLRLRGMNQFFLFSGPSGGNFRVISPLSTELGFGISCFRQRGAFVKWKVQDVRVCQKKVWNEWASPKESVRHASPGLEKSTMSVRREIRKGLELKPCRLHFLQLLQSIWYIAHATQNYKSRFWEYFGASHLHGYFITVIHVVNMANMVLCLL
jgi:hypothetical protein